MFKLSKNQYTSNNICIYTDEYGNSAFFKRTEEGFTTKLRFMNQNIKASPIYINIPIKEGVDGENLHLDYRSDVDIEAEDISEAISGYQNLLNRWIDMVYDMKLLEAHKGMDSSIISEDINRLKKYEELSKIIELL